MPEQICLEQACPNPAHYRGRCYLHSKERDRQIERSGRATYSTKQWKYARRAKLDENRVLNDALCERCRDGLATEVHHRQAIADGGAEYEMRNLEALCRSCHSRETRSEQILRSGGRVRTGNG